MKKILFLILMAVMVNGQWSMVNAQSTLNIHTTTNGTVCFTFAEKPQMSFKTTEVLTISSTTVTVEFPYAEVEKITFNDDDPTAVPMLTVREAKTDEVRIYDLSGKLVRRSRSRQGTVSVDLSTLPTGVYIVKDGKRTYKVSKQ